MASTDDECGMFQDPQLLHDTMAGSIDRPYTFICSGVSGNDLPQVGPRFTDCAGENFFSFTNLCIGGIKDQHACSVGTCNVVDWSSGAVAAPCASNIMNFASNQAPGLATPCCDSDGCTVPSAKYVCDASRTLQLCVVDATAAQCVEPSSNTICSGNFSAAVAVPGSTGNTSPITAPNTIPANGNNAAASSGGHPGLANADIIAIGAVLGPVLIAVAGGLRYLFLKKKKAGGRDGTTITISYFFGISGPSASIDREQGRITASPDLGQKSF